MFLNNIKVFEKLGTIGISLLLSLFIANSAEANYTIKLSESVDSSDISPKCKQVFFNVFEDIYSKEPQQIRPYLDGNWQNLELMIVLDKTNIMTSPGLQTYWSNILYNECSYISKVSFGRYATDWIINYVPKNGKMIAAFKEGPNVVNLEYRKARNIIIKEGWKPLNTEREEKIGGYTGFVASKYPEVYDCAGTGAGPCMFFFKNPDDNYYLRVVTTSQFFDDEDGKVAGIEIIDVYGAIDYELGVQ